MRAVLLLWFLWLPQAGEFDAVFREGLVALQNGDLAKAADRLGRAVQLKQDSGVAWAAFAQAHLKLQNPAEADRAALQAEKVAGNQPVVLRALVIYWSGRGQYDPVIRLATRALEHEDRPELRNVLGKAYLASNRYEEGVAELRRAALVRPVQEKFIFDLGQALLSRERFDEAAEVFETGTTESAQLQLALGVARYGQRRFAEAITAFLKTTELQPDVEQPYVFLGKILDHAGDRLPEIEARMGAFLKADPDHPAANLVYAKVLVRKPDAKVEIVEQHLRRSIAKDARSWEAHFELGVLLSRAKRYEDAANELRAAAKLKPDEATVHYHLARVYDRLGKPEQAAKERLLHGNLVKKTGGK